MYSKNSKCPGHDAVQGWQGVPERLVWQKLQMQACPGCGVITPSTHCRAGAFTSFAFIRSRLELGLWLNSQETG
eukprot:1159916-Pelagomonas_calceolata.AAC.3